MNLWGNSWSRRCDLNTRPAHYECLPKPLTNYTLTHCYWHFTFDSGDLACLKTVIKVYKSGGNRWLSRVAATTATKLVSINKYYLFFALMRELAANCSDIYLEFVGECLTKSAFMKRLSNRLIQVCAGSGRFKPNLLALAALCRSYASGISCSGNESEISRGLNKIYSS